MTAERQLSRRAILAAVSTATIGTVVTTAATAQERDPTEYDRPLTVEENGIETTFHDCAHVIIDSDLYSVVDRMMVSSAWTTPDNHVQPERVDMRDVELPFEFIVNCHRDELGVEYGLATLGSINVWHDEDEYPANFHLPFHEWDCGDIRDREFDPRDFEEICQ
ncbi:hypothetical protein [Natronorubrum sp. FCH18a]|uniref:hypothetical protein n=1 Tax=Natronorubrum sp. FCH18a TaxID=3447018 RepID=UPI003F513863